MNNDLIERLTDWTEYDEGKINDVREEAADTLKELTKERDISRMANIVMDNTVKELEAKLKTAEEIGRAFEEDAGQLRAKLARAIEALDYCIKAPFSGWTIAQGYARTVIAKLEEE